MARGRTQSIATSPQGTARTESSAGWDEAFGVASTPCLHGVAATVHHVLRKL